MAPIFRSIRLKYGRHYLGHPQANFSCSLWFAVICRSSEIVASGNKWFVLNETIEVVSIFKIILPAVAEIPKKLLSLRQMDRINLAVSAKSTYPNTWWKKCFLANFFPISTAYHVQQRRKLDSKKLNNKLRTVLGELWWIRNKHTCFQLSTLQWYGIYMHFLSSNVRA